MKKLFVAATVAASLLVPAVRAQNPPPAGASQPAASQPAANPPAASQPAGATVHVEGFRSAKWGMSEAEVKAAVQSDFKITADKLKPETNTSEKTTVLTILVPDLIDGAGTARVSYILGYTTKKLIQVNITWGAPADPQAKPEMVVAAANQLHQLFVEAGYDPGTIVSDVRAPDGAIVVFQGQDAERHTTLLRLLSAQTAPGKDGKSEAKDKPAIATALFLSYIMDSKSPDVFRLKKGQF
jgi:hypothetical protein